MPTKIIATIGPTSDTPEMIEALALSGMAVMRNNFAHCTYPEYTKRLKIIQKINKKHGLNVLVQQDLRGPVIRIGENIPKRGRKVKEGDILTFVTEPCKDKKRGEIIVDDPYLHADVKVGDPMLIESGMIELVIVEAGEDSHKFKAKVVVGGVIFRRKAINLPTTKLTTDSVTEKDIRDLKFALKAGVDIVALSFVGTAADIQKIRDIIGKQKVLVAAKIERRQALENLDEIIDASDMIIVARGDLGVETPYEELPIVQKMMVLKCNQKNTPVVVATQMLKHMTKSPYPTRAEISDIANAIFDGADYVWLSDETANGDYPLESIRVMKKVVDKVDCYIEKGEDNCLLSNPVRY